MQMSQEDYDHLIFQQPNLLRRWLLKHYHSTLSESELPDLEEVFEIMTTDPITLLEPMARDNPGLGEIIANQISNSVL